MSVISSNLSKAVPFLLEPWDGEWVVGMVLRMTKRLGYHNPEPLYVRAYVNAYEPPQDVDEWNIKDEYWWARPLFNIGLNELAYRHTLLIGVRVFLERCPSGYWRDYGDSVPLKLAWTVGSNLLRFCEECRQEQIATHGCASVLRFHNMPGTLRCIVHGCLLGAVERPSNLNNVSTELLERLPESVCQRGQGLEHTEMMQAAFAAELLAQGIPNICSKIIRRMLIAAHLSYRDSSNDKAERNNVEALIARPGPLQAFIASSEMRLTASHLPDLLYVLPILFGGALPAIEALRAEAFPWGRSYALAPQFSSHPLRMAGESR